MIPFHHNVNSSFVIDDALRQLSLMCKQEELWYSKVDYTRSEKSSSQNKELDIDEYSRCQMMTWCFDVANFCNLNHNTVEMAMNYIDRFMMTSAGHDVLFDRSLYQLVCMTALYTITKVQELRCIDLPLLQSLSRNLYTEKQFATMESVMLNAVHWHINAPTTAMYIDLILKLIPTSVIPICHHEHIRKHAQEQAEYLLLEKRMISTKSSVIAYCSIMSVIDELNCMNDILSTQLPLALNIDSTTAEIKWICRHLYSTMNTFSSSLSSIQISIEQQKEEAYECYPIHEKINMTSLLSSTTKNMTSSCISPQNVSVTLHENT